MLDFRPSDAIQSNSFHNFFFGCIHPHSLIAVVVVVVIVDAFVVVIPLSAVAAGCNACNVSGSSSIH